MRIGLNIVMRTISKIVYETDGWVALRFPAEGLRCEIEIPVRPAP